MNLKNTSNYTIASLMSGTSLDGVDIAICKIALEDEKWLYEIIKAETIPYSAEWKQTLLSLEDTPALRFQQINIEYGFYLGKLLTNFIAKHAINPDFIASHGHTIFHADFTCSLLKSTDGNALTKKLTVQIGAGSAIAAECDLPVVCDFRTLDVALGGQGAPLVPIGDMLLFAEYDFCLNLGGFANVSYQYNNQRIAFDICPVNIVMNAVCATIGKEYDNDGELASSGIVNEELLNELNNLSFYQLPLNSPKSLGKEWVIEHINPLLKKYELSPKNILRTIVEHVAMQIANVLKTKPEGEILVTGGGTFNTFLLERIKKHTSHQLIIPPKSIIEFKEALIFAFLGVLRIRNEINCLKSVTGAKANSAGGIVYRPLK
jgi:anhydro-N-acetylmuramic acid kinase